MQSRRRTDHAGCRIARLAVTALLLAGAHPVLAQQPVTLEEAVAAALANAPRLAAVRADSAAAEADVSLARAFPNPALNLGYSQSVPRRHIEIEQALEYPWIRALRIRAARTAVRATGALRAAERAAVRYDAEIAYAEAAAAGAVLRLSLQDAAAVEQLLGTVRARQIAGDASALDVDLASVTAGQIRSGALSDSLRMIDATLALQTLMGLPSDRVVIETVDSLAALPIAPPPPGTTTLRVAAARLQDQAQQVQIALARRARFPVPAVRIGFEQGDPSGAESGILPTIGVSLPLPLFNRGLGDVARAEAAAARSAAELAQLERETVAARAAAERRRDIARRRLALDRAQLGDAERVATLSLVAYREGAYPLATVLDAQRSARAALRQYIEDAAASRTADAALRLVETAGGTAP